MRALEQGPPLSKVERMDVRWTDATGGFADFDVRFAEQEA